MDGIDRVDTTAEAAVPLPNIDLNLLVAFDALVSERNVTRAAERLSIGQPAMSAALGRLRRLFDDPLLVRQGRHLVTTPLADSLVAPVREALSIIDRTIGERTGFDAATNRRVFTVMTSDYVALIMLRPLLVDLARSAPHVRIRLVPLAADFEEQLRRQQIDLLITPSELLARPVAHRTAALFSDRYVCAVDGQHPEVGDEITREQFTELPYLAYNAGALDSLAEQQLDAAGIDRRVEITVEAFMLAPYLLVGTRLTTLLLERHAKLVRDDLRLRLVDPPVPLRPVLETMAWSPRKDHDAGHAWLRDQLLGVARQL